MTFQRDPSIEAGERDLGRKPRLSVHVLVAAAIVVAYAGIVNVPFLFDDHKNLVESPLVRSRSLWPLATPDYYRLSGEPLHYRPIATLSWLLVDIVAPASPVAQHVVNLVLHLTGALLVLWLAARLAGPGAPAALAALWFGLHPAIAETVLVVTFRRDAMVLVLEGLALLALVRIAGTPGLWAAALLHLLALGSKEPATVWTVLLPALVVTCQGRLGVPAAGVRRRALSALIALAVMTCTYWGARLALEAESVVTVERPLPITASDRGLRAVAQLGIYIRLLLWPWPLSFDRPNAPVVSIGDPDVWLGAAGVLASVAALAWRRRIDRAIGAGLALFWLSLAPALLAVHLRTAERYLTVPAAGAALILAGITGRLSAWGRAPLVALAVIVAVNASVLLHQVRTFADPLALFGQAVAAFPSSTMARVSLAEALRKVGRYDEARAQLEVAQALAPGMDAALHGLAVVARATGDLALAHSHYRAYLDRHTLREDVVAVEYAALLFLDLGLVTEAVVELERRAATSRHVALLLGLADAYVRLGLDYRARTVLLSARRLSPGDERIERALAMLTPWDREPEHQRRAYADLMQGGDVGPQTALGRGTGLLALGRLEEARHELERARGRPSDTPVARARLGRILRLEGRLAEARAELEAALAARPDLEEARAEMDRLRVTVQGDGGPPDPSRRGRSASDADLPR